MTLDEALKLADQAFGDVLASGDAEVFEPMRGPDGRIMTATLAMTAHGLRGELATYIRDEHKAGRECSAQTTYTVARRLLIAKISS